MLDPYAETVRFVFFALVIGLVVFGGTTLAYFLDKRRADPPRRGPAQHVEERSPEVGPGEDLGDEHDRAA